MKINKYVNYYDGDGEQISSIECNLSDIDFRNVFGINPNEIIASHSIRPSESQKRKFLSSYPCEGTVYIIVEWRIVASSIQEKNELIKKFIKSARENFQPSDNSINEWMKKKLGLQWMFEAYMKEEKWSMAVESLHVMTQCFYDLPLAPGTVSRNLDEARKLLALQE